MSGDTQRKDTVSRCQRQTLTSIFTAFENLHPYVSLCITYRFKFSWSLAKIQFQSSARAVRTPVPASGPPLTDKKSKNASFQLLIDSLRLGFESSPGMGQSEAHDFAYQQTCAQEGQCSADDCHLRVPYISLVDTVNHMCRSGPQLHSQDDDAANDHSCACT